jgi:hypothetical protein
MNELPHISSEFAHIERDIAKLRRKLHMTRDRLTQACNFISERMGSTVEAQRFVARIRCDECDGTGLDQMSGTAFAEVECSRCRNGRVIP